MATIPPSVIDSSSTQYCSCTGMRFCNRCKDSDRVRQAQLDAQHVGISSVHSVFDKNAQNISQSSCSFASLPPVSPFELCLACGRVFDKLLLERETASFFEGDGAKRCETSSTVLHSREETLPSCAWHLNVQVTLHSHVQLNGVFMYPEIITEEEEMGLIRFLDTPNDRFTGWKISQSGRRKQDFGPQANFKKRKLKLREDVPGIPVEFKDLFARVQGLVEASTSSSSSDNAFTIVESSALEYDPTQASNLDPHIDDVWIWGPRVAGVSLNSSAVMTFVSPQGIQVDVLLPRRAAFLLSGDARYAWLHGIRHSGVPSRRLSITMRELNPAANVDEALQNEIAQFSQRYV